MREPDLTRGYIVHERNNLMSDYQFASEYSRQNNLPLQIAEAAKEWRLAALDYDRTLEDWNAEADPPPNAPRTKFSSVQWKRLRRTSAGVTDSSAKVEPNASG